MNEPARAVPRQCTSEITDGVAIAEPATAASMRTVLPEYALKLVLGGIPSLRHRQPPSRPRPRMSRFIPCPSSTVAHHPARLATFEMMYIDDVPTSVTINEAVELAKDFRGRRQPHRFVNSISAHIAKMEGRRRGGSQATQKARRWADASDSLSLTLRIPHATRLSPSRHQGRRSRRKESLPWRLSHA